MRTADGFRNEALGSALDHAVAGDTRALYELLARLGGLPGPRANEGVVAAFANECVARGASCDALVTKMATLHVDTAPGASKYEILPICGVAALGGRAAGDPTAMRALATLHDCCEDLRFRVRERVAQALARIGEQRGEPLVHDLATWMDGFFHAATVLDALSDPKWLARIGSPDAVIARLDEAFVLAREAQRAASRYPGFKALMESLGRAPVACAMRFGVPVLDMLERWSAVKDPTLRAVVQGCASSPKLVRFRESVEKVQGALDAMQAPRRDPRTYVGPTRGRGKKGKR